MPFTSDIHLDILAAKFLKYRDVKPNEHYQNSAVTKQQQKLGQLVVPLEEDDVQS